MSIQNFLEHRPSVENYMAHPFAAREGVAEFANHPESARSPEVLHTLIAHHDGQALSHNAKGHDQYRDPKLGPDAGERAATASFAQSRGHAEAASLLRGLL